MITATEGLTPNGEQCWVIFEVEELDKGDTDIKKIAEFRTREEAVAFCDGANWDGLKQSLWAVRMRVAISEDAGEPAEQVWGGK